MTENGRDVSDEPVEGCEVETPDYSRFRPESVLEHFYTPRDCYTTRQVARKLRVSTNDVHNFCRKPHMAKALGRQQSATGHEIYYHKTAVNEFCN